MQELACPERADGLTVYAQILGYTDNLNMLRVLLSYPMINWVGQFFSRTRDGDTELFFVDNCREIIRQNMDRVSADEYARFDKELINYELSAYDRLNLWQDYIRLFEEVRKEKSYTIKYGASRNDSVFNSYVLHQDSDCKYVHFLYLSDHRYKIICRKQARKEAGKGVEHLKMHQKDALTDAELEARYNELARLFEYLKQYYTR